MKTFEIKEYEDTDGDAIEIDCKDTHVEISIYHSCGAWPCENPETLRAMAAQLIRGAEQLEIGK